MPKNAFFAFKHFRVAQDRCAMKVSTDACIFGAWVAAHLQNTTGRALDIGTGTGLLSLMVAQQASELLIDAVEIDIAAALQATENVLQSPFAERIRVFACSIQEFLKTATSGYDAVFSNPPFFHRSLSSPQSRRNIARHTLSLNHEELLTAAAERLNPSGYFFVLLPADVADAFVLQATAKDLLLHERQQWAAREDRKPHIALLKFGKLPCMNASDTVCRVFLPDGSYSPEMRRLLEAYYLCFSEGKSNFPKNDSRNQRQA